MFFQAIGEAVGCSSVGVNGERLSFECANSVLNGRKAPWARSFGYLLCREAVISARFCRRCRVMEAEESQGGVDERLLCSVAVSESTDGAEETLGGTDVDERRRERGTTVVAFDEWRESFGLRESSRAVDSLDSGGFESSLVRDLVRELLRAVRGREDDERRELCRSGVDVKGRECRCSVVDGREPRRSIDGRWFSFCTELRRRSRRCDATLSRLCCMPSSFGSSMALHQVVLLTQETLLSVLSLFFSFSTVILLMVLLLLEVLFLLMVLVAVLVEVLVVLLQDRNVETLIKERGVCARSRSVVRLGSMTERLLNNEGLG